MRKACASGSMHIYMSPWYCGGGNAVAQMPHEPGLENGCVAAFPVSGTLIVAMFQHTFACDAPLSIAVTGESRERTSVRMFGMFREVSRSAARVPVPTPPPWEAPWEGP